MDDTRGAAARPSHEYPRVHPQVRSGRRPAAADTGSDERLPW